MHRLRRSALLAGVLVICGSAVFTGVARGQDAALIKKGEEAFTAQKCAVCHSIGGKGAKANPLDGVGAKVSADDLRAWITDPVAMTKKTNSQKKPPMPKNAKLTPADVDALVAYMQSLK
jgi:mono/diheme cytochrome c family protein